MMLCAIWYHYYNLKNVRNIHGGLLFLVKLQPLASNFTKSDNPPWVFSRFLNGKMIPDRATHQIYGFQIWGWRWGFIDMEHWRKMGSTSEILVLLGSLHKKMKFSIKDFFSK